MDDDPDCSCANTKGARGHSLKDASKEIVPQCGRVAQAEAVVRS